MTYQTPKTWATDEPLNAVNLNTWIRDQQAALRTLIDSAGGDTWSDAMERDFTTGLSINRARYTDLIVPQNAKFIYAAVRHETDDYWTAFPLVDFAIWNAFSLATDGDNISGADRMRVRQPSGTQADVYLGKGTGGVLWFGVRDAANEIDKICVRWLT